MKKIASSAIFLFLCSVIIFISPLQAKETPCVAPDCIEFPKDAGFINVRDFGATGDGITDDTDSINAALATSGDDTGSLFWQDKIVYFPAGTYLVSETISKKYKNGNFASGAVMIGKSSKETIIKLKDNASGYDNPSSPKAVIFTSSKLLDGSPTSGNKDYINKGEGNDSYNNFVENMTIDVGEGNAGAIGIDYLANNFGAVRNVAIKSSAQSGAIGISLKRKWAGPALLSNVTIEGFDTGIETDNTEYGITIDSLILKNQRKIGLLNNHNVVSANNLQISGSPQPLINQAEDGLVVLVGSELESSEKKAEAYINKGTMNIRNSIANGKAIDGVYEKNNMLSASAQDWSLPVKQSPETIKEPMKNWVAVNLSQTDEDATGAVRKAFNSGASSIYFPYGNYDISDNIIIPASVQRIIGMGSTIRAVKQRSPKFSRELGFLRVTGGGNPLTIEHLAFDNSYLGDQVGVELSGKRSLILRDVVGAGVTTLKRTATGGEAFLENTCCGLLDFAGKNGIWARQLNTEGGRARIVNDGAPLWVLGIKTERNCTVLENKNGAQTEVLGGLLYIVQPPEKPMPAFRNIDAKLLVSYAEEAFDPKATYQTHIMGSKKGVENIVKADDLPKRNKARMAGQIVNN